MFASAVGTTYFAYRYGSYIIPKDPFCHDFWSKNACQKDFMHSIATSRTFGTWQWNTLSLRDSLIFTLFCITVLQITLQRRNPIQNTQQLLLIHKRITLKNGLPLPQHHDCWIAHLSFITCIMCCNLMCS